MTEEKCSCNLCDMIEHTTWISINERVPTKEECAANYGWFLVFRTGAMKGRADLSRYDGWNEEFSYDHGWKYVWDDHITHWMPLPTPPEE